MSEAPHQDPYAPPPPPPAPGQQSVPPASAQTPPPAPPSAQPYPSFGYQQTGPIPGYQNTGPVPTFPPAAPQPTGAHPSAVRGAGATFFSSLFDLSFSTYITRRLAGVFYVIGLIAIGIGAIGALFSGLAGAFAALSSSYTAGIGIITLFASVIGVPLIALVLVIALRLGLEAGVALIAVAENTGRLAADSEPKKN